MQGLTGREGTFHAKQAQAYGTIVVGGVTPGKGGTTHEGWPVFDTVRRSRQGDRRQRVSHLRAAAGGADAIMEAADAGLALAVCITEGIPVHRHDARAAFIEKTPMRLIGPNCPGIITAGQAKAGIIPGHICKPGRVGIVSKSGTLTYEAIHQLTGLGLGQTTCIGIGGDPLIGTSFIDALKLFADDPETEAVVLIGEIGGSAEEEAAAFIQSKLQETGRRIHRRANRAAGPTDGARRRDHRRRQGHGGGENAGAARRRRARREEPGRHRQRRGKKSSAAVKVAL